MSVTAERISGENGLDLKPGDIIEIKGENRTTAAIYWRSRPEDAKMDIIRVDGIIRKNVPELALEIEFQSQKSKPKPVPNWYSLQ